MVAAFQLVVEAAVLLAQLAGAQRALDGEQQRLAFEGLGQVVVGAGPDRGNRVLDAAVGGDQDEAQLGSMPAHFGQHLQAVAVGQFEVGNHKAQRVIVKQRRRAIQAARFGNAIAGLVQRLAHQFALGRVVLDQQQVNVGAFPLAGHQLPLRRSAPP